MSGKASRDVSAFDMSKMHESLMSAESDFQGYTEELNVDGAGFRKYDLVNVFDRTAADEEIDSDDAESIIKEEIFTETGNLISENVIETVLPLQGAMDLRMETTNDNFYRMLNILTPEARKKDFERETDLMLEVSKTLDFDVEDDNIEPDMEAGMQLRPRNTSQRRKKTKKSEEKIQIPSSNSVPNLKTETVATDTQSLPASTFSSDKSNLIGIYSPAKRRILIDNYLSKRKRRVWKKRIKYEVRKSFADSRLRVKGRFISKKDEDILREAVLFAF